MPVAYAPFRERDRRARAGCERDPVDQVTLRDPDAAAGEHCLARPAREAERLTRLTRLRIDARDRVALPVEKPDASRLRALDSDKVPRLLSEVEPLRLARGRVVAQH